MNMLKFILLKLDAYYNYFVEDYLVHNTSCDINSSEEWSTPIIKEFAFNTNYYDSTGSTSTPKI